MYDVGDLAHLAIAINDAAGAAVDSTVALSITLPDQSTAGPFTVPAVSHDSTGRYSYDYLTAQPGRHVARWSGSNVAFAQTQVFDVETADLSLVSLDDVKRQLGMTGTGNDDELRSYILSASENIEGACGPCAVRVFTERVLAATCRSFWLANPPVVAVTGFTPVRPATTPPLSPAEVVVDAASGKVTRLDGGWFFGQYDVTYTAGRPVIPSSLRTACTLIAQHLWDTRRGVAGVPAGGQDLTTPPGFGYAIPNRAAELLAPYREAPFLA
jgi:hypothetical protein